MNDQIYTGKTVDDAISVALGDLEADRDEVDVTIVQSESQGFLGLFGRKARARVTLRDEDKIRITYILRKLTRRMGYDVTVRSREKDNKVYAYIDGGGKDLIGNNGSVLEALEYISERFINRDRDALVRVELDVDGYRRQREKELGELVDRLCRKVSETGKESRTDALGDIERRMVTSALKKRRELRFRLEGRGPYKRVIIMPRRSQRKPRSGDEKKEQ